MSTLSHSKVPPLIRNMCPPFSTLRLITLLKHNAIFEHIPHHQCLLFLSVLTVNNDSQLSQKSNILKVSEKFCL